ncbi:MAG: serine hydrolase, partial [Candidatus Uhrbacteria bacterium]|nr:serine hydrolase [Candidatus Uhrbacteria bacterium]
DRHYEMPYVIRLCLVFGGLFLASMAQAATIKVDAEPFVPKANEFAKVIVIVPKTHQVLWSFKPDYSHVAASLTKLPNALTFVKLSPRWDRKVAFQKSDEVGGGRLRVKIGTRISIRDLFYSSITSSANNAANALARVSGLGYGGFIKRMNVEAKRLGAVRSKFVDASGMSPRNITTARDMALIAEAAFRELMIRTAASTGEYQVALATPREVRTIKNTNQLLTQDNDLWIVGGKTGYLEESMYNLVIQVRPMNADGRPEFGKDLIVVVLGAPTKSGSFDAAKRLAEWTWNNHEF